MATTDAFFERPILNSPYECPSRHWELDASGQPTNKIIAWQTINAVRRPGSRRFTRRLVP